MKAVILAGGGGTRLFPLARLNYPKQFLKINNSISVFAKTLIRIKKIFAPEDIIIVTGQAYYYQILDEVKNCACQGAHIVIEPSAQNTAPAIILAASFCREKLKVSQQEVLVIVPADNLIEPDELFKATVLEAVEIAKQEKLVVFGVEPYKAETGYGYIKKGSRIGKGFTVEAFKEKPDIETATFYMQSKEYFWNSGMFSFSIDFLNKQLMLHNAELSYFGQKSFDELVQDFSEIVNVSFDYALVEKTKDAVVLPLEYYWTDIGSWDSIYEMLSKNEDGNALLGDCMPIDCKNSLLWSEGRLVAAIGLEDILFVDTADVSIIAKKGDSQKVRAIVDDLKALKRREAYEHKTIYRPWGQHTILGENQYYKIKKVIVNAGQKLPMQLHYHRSEHWIVLNGTALANISGKEYFIHENESVFIGQSSKYQLINPGKIALELIEVQNGKYLEEDDALYFEEE